GEEIARRLPAREADQRADRERPREQRSAARIAVAPPPPDPGGNERGPRQEPAEVVPQLPETRARLLPEVPVAVVADHDRADVAPLGLEQVRQEPGQDREREEPQAEGQPQRA